MRNWVAEGIASNVNDFTVISLCSVLWKMVKNCHVHEDRQVGRSQATPTKLFFCWFLWSEIYVIQIWLWYFHCFWNAKVILPNVLLENQHFVAIPSICFRGPWFNVLIVKKVQTIHQTLVSTFLMHCFNKIIFSYFSLWKVPRILFSNNKIMIQQVNVVKQNWTIQILKEFVIHSQADSPYLINIWQMFNVAIDNLAMKPYIPQKKILQWIFCKGFAW